MRDDEDLEELVTRLAEIDNAVEFLRQRHLHDQADRVEEQAEHVLRRAEDQGALPTLLWPEGDGFVALQTPSEADVAAWLFRTPAPFSEGILEEDLDDDQRRQLHAAIRVLADSFHAGRARADRAAAGSIDRDTANTVKACRRALRDLLDTGLQARLGERLSRPELTVHDYLTARDIRPSRSRVCEACKVVFAAQRARRCPKCTHAPVRISPRPWHTRIVPADPAAGSRVSLAVSNRDAAVTLTVAISRRRGPTTTIYSSRCQACGIGFDSTDARRRLCDPCRTPAARTARSRARRRTASGEPHRRPPREHTAKRTHR